MEELYCGTDIGTSSVKIIVFDKNFKPLYKVINSYELISREKNRAELNPDEVYNAVIKGLRECYEKVKGMGRLKFISFSSALHSMIAVDESFNPLTNCITWADTRAMEFNDMLEDYYNENDIYNKTGCLPHAIYMPAKILWLKKYKPDVYEKTEKFITIKEYVIKKITGKAVVDYSLASGSGILNIHHKDWEQNLLNYLGLKKENFSCVIDGKVILKMKEEVTKIIGGDIPLVIGSGDGPLANLGAGALSGNKYVATIGSSGAVRVFSNSPVLDPKAKTWCYMLDKDIYLPGGAINNGGIVLQWLKDNLFDGFKGEEDDFYSLINNYVKEIPPGSRGLIFLPFLTGERSPNWNPYARGLIIGLSLAHTNRDLAKAAMEGILFRMNSIILALEDLMFECDEVLANGGFTRSEAWLQMMADVFGKKVISYKDHEASATGAAMIGAVACGDYPDYTSIKAEFEIDSIKLPDPDRHKKYRSIFELHERIYDRNREFFQEIAQY